MSTELNPKWARNQDFTLRRLDQLEEYLPTRTAGFYSLLSKEGEVIYVNDATDLAKEALEAARSERIKQHFPASVAYKVAPMKESPSPEDLQARYREVQDLERTLSPRIPSRKAKLPDLPPPGTPPPPAATTP